MHQSIQGKEVTFKDVLILFFKKFERILAVALIFAVLFAAYGAWRGYSAISGENMQQQLDDYQIALDEYNTSTQTLRDTIERDQQRLDSLQEYTEQSIYYNLDPYNEAVSELIFYIDTGYQIAPSQYYQNPNKTGELVSAYCDAYRSAELYEGVSDILGQEVEIKYIDELLTIERAGDIQIRDSVGNVTVKHSDGNEGVIVIRARAQDEETASEITSFVYNYLREQFGDTIAEHTTTIISDSTMRVMDSELEQILCFDSAIDAEKFASEKSAIFLILPEEDTTKNFMAGLMIQNLSRELFAVADENGGKLKNRVVLFCDEFGTMPPFDILPLFSAGRSRRLTLVPIIQSLAQLEKNYGKEGCEIIQDNCQDTIFGGFAPNSQTAEVLSKALGSRTVLSGSVSRGKNDPSQSLQMMERALLTPDELKSIPKGSFIVMKTGTHPMRTRLQLFLNWGITFGEPYVVPERANRAVAYANRVDLERNLPQLSEPEEMDESRGYAVSSRGGIAHAPAQERAVKRGKQMKTFGEEER